jgi:hypothetical protein
MDMLLTIRGIISPAEVAKLQRLLETLYPEAHVQVVSGSQVRPPMGPTELKGDGYQTTATVVPEFG